MKKKVQGSRFKVQGPLLAILAWFIFSLNGHSVLEEPRLVSSKPFETSEKCVKTARLLQAGRLAPFYYCAGSETVRELPPLIQQQHIFSVEGARGGE